MILISYFCHNHYLKRNNLSIKPIFEQFFYILYNSFICSDFHLLIKKNRNV